MLQPNISILYYIKDDDRSTDGDSVGNSLYFSQGAIPKPCPRKQSDISSGFVKKVVGDATHKVNLEQHVPRKAKDIIESWTWGNQPG